MRKMSEIIDDIRIKFKNICAYTNYRVLHNFNMKSESPIYEFVQFYHSIEFKKTNEVSRKLCEYIQTITKVSSNFVWLVPQEGANSLIQMTPENKHLEEKIANGLEQTWRDLQNEEKATMVQLVDSWYYLAPIKTTKRFYGFIGVSWDEASCVKSKERLHRYVRTLAEWSTIIYERVHTEYLTAKSMVEEEQKRICGEIHDLISGRLFSVVCATSILTRSAELEVKDREQLKLIASTVNQAHSELRSIIYSLKANSTKQRFGQQIKRYLDAVAKLHGISISLRIDEESASIGGSRVRALHRIICEAVSNAVEHGQCKHLSVELIYEGSELHLIITDDGIGFQTINCTEEHKGLGLCNIVSLANSMNGMLFVESHSGLGTKIRIIVQNEEVETSSRPFKEEVS